MERSMNRKVLAIHYETQGFRKLTLKQTGIARGWEPLWP